jgi:hypothetical protein
MGRILYPIREVDACQHTRAVGVPKYAVASRLDKDYELSTKSFRSTDLRRIC